MAIHTYRVHQSLRMHNSMKKGIEETELITEFNLSSLDFNLYQAAFMDIGAGFYITIYKGSGKFNTTVSHPFELIFYKYDEDGGSVLKWNYKKVSKLKTLNFLNKQELVESIEKFIKEQNTQP